MNKELSIIAVVIDNLEITKRFISSIRQYTNCNYELILIDNGSKDKKAINFIKKSSDICYRFNKRTDLAKAWNKGIELSSGKFICIANNDTIVPKGWFKKLRKPFEKDKKCGMVSPLTLWNYNFGIETKRIKSIKKSPLLNQASSLIKLKRWNQGVWGEFLLFKKKILDEIGGFSEEYLIASGEDIDILFTLYKKKYNVYINPEVFVYHEGGASSFVLGKKKQKKIWDDNYYKIFKKKWKGYSKDI